MSKKTKREDADPAPGSCCSWPRHKQFDLTTGPTWDPPALPGAEGGWRYVAEFELRGRDQPTRESHWWEWDPTLTHADNEADRQAVLHALELILDWTPPKPSK
jgi:hypothetical protein